MEVALLLVGIVALGAVVGLVGRARHRSRASELQAWAASHGWGYVERDAALGERFLGEPFGRGYARTGVHVLTGEHRGHRVLAFEYRFREPSGTLGQSRRTIGYRYPAVAVPTPAPRPVLQVGREHPGTRILSAIGLDDWQLGDEAFDRAFRVRMADAAFARDVLHPLMVQWLLADGRSLPFRFERADLVCWQRGGLRPERALGMADYLVDVLDRVPQGGWRE